MASVATALTAAAGEHFVAYKLSAMGFPVALTRGGSPAVDLMVGDLSGKRVVSLQVKTSRWAWRAKVRKPEDSHWEWDVGRRALDLRGERLLYAFVDLRWQDNEASVPCVFIVPSIDVAEWLDPSFTRFMFWIFKKDEREYLECWERITKLLPPRA